MFDFKRALKSALATHPDDPLTPLLTPWGEALDPENVLPEYPRPQLRRGSYTNLNGWWDCAFMQNDTQPDAYGEPENTPPAEYDARILVPFSPEAPLSGVMRQLQPDETLWYRRYITVTLHAGMRALLHFEAVDFECACFVNGRLLGTHRGGYTPFAFDMTDALISGNGDGIPSELQAEAEIALAVKDPSEHGGQPRGKQRIDRGSIWCTAQSGIWQTVWIEEVPELHIETLHIVPDPDTETLSVTARIRNAGTAAAEAALSVELTEACEAEGREGTPGSVASKTGREGVPRTTSPVRFTPSHPSNASSEDRASADEEGAKGFGEIKPGAPSPTAISESPAETVNPGEIIELMATMPVENPHLWSPDDPYLHGLRVTCGDDQVESYCAFRTFSIEEQPDGSRLFCCNHEPLFLKGLLDQGYWPDGLLTAPSDEALLYDIELARSLGFNMLRKHLKIEQARWYFHCDRLGMLVWQDTVNGGAREYPAFWTSHLPTVFPVIARHIDDTKKLERFGAESELARELWLREAERLMVHLRNFPCIATWTVFNEGWGQFNADEMLGILRAIDDTRPFDQTSGWFDQDGGDYISEHNYFRDLLVPRKRHADDRRAPAITEFGGLAYYVEGHSAVARAYGYAIMETLGQFQTEVRKQLDQVDALQSRGLAGYVYTQLSDVEEEVNGLVTYDRRVRKLRR